MSEHQQRKNRLRREWYITNAIGFALVAVLMLAKLSQPIGDVIYDHFIRMGRFMPANNVIIISVDDHSLQELGGWPLKRDIYTQLLKQLDTPQTRPKAVAFDLLFLDPTSSDEDFAAELSKLPVVLPLEFKVGEDAKQSLRPVYPVYPISQAVSLGHINLSFDKDGVIRGFQTQEQQWKHLSLALHAKGELAPMRAEGVSHYYRFRIVDPQVGFPMVSLADALNNQITPTIFKDKYVLIGVTAPSLGDRYPTLYSGKDSASTPGVEILASILNASLKDKLIVIGSQSVVLILSCAAILLMMHSLVRLTPRVALVFSAIFLVFVSAVSYFTLSLLNVWLDPAALIVVLITLHPIWAWRRLEALVSFMQDKTSNLVELKQVNPAHQSNKGSREVILRYTRLLDQAVQWAQNELGFLSQIVDEIPDAIAIFDNKDHLLLHNQRMAIMFDTARLQTGVHLTTFANNLQLPTPVTQNLFNSEDPALSALKNVFTLETLVGTQDFYLKSSRIDLKGEMGDIRLIILVDVTQLRQSQVQRDRALQFLSHDMRTPLASILSLTRNTLIHDALDRDKIVQHANTLLSMMDDFILTISSEAPQYQLSVVLIDDVINDAIEAMIDLAQAKSIQIIDESVSEGLFVKINTRLMLRVLTNLLFNAIKFAPAHTSIHIQTAQELLGSQQTPYLGLRIRNTVDPQKGKGDLNLFMHGFGLGLNFVDIVVKKHNGNIQRTIPPNGFAVVHIQIPLQ